MGQRGLKRGWPAGAAKNLLVLLGSLGLTLAAGEAFIRFYEPQVLAAPGARESFHPPIYRSHERLGHELRPGISYDHRSPYGDFRAFIRVNSEGFRGRPVSRDKSPGTFRIFVVGDSFPFGMGVNDEEAFPARLEALLNGGSWRNPGGNPIRFEVINGGVPGYNLAHYYLMLKLKALRYEPDLILLSLLPWNDFDLGDQEWERDGEGLPASVRDKFYVDPEGRLRQRGEDHLEARSWAINILPTPVKEFLTQNSHLYHFIGERLYRLWKNLAGGGSPWVQEAWAGEEKPKGLTQEEGRRQKEVWRQNWEKGLSLLEGIRRLAEGRGVRLAVLLIPHLYQSHEPFLTPQYVEAPQAGLQLLSWFEARRVPYLNLVRALDPYDEYELYLKHDKHFTVKGNELTARFLFDFLLGHSLIPRGEAS